MPVTALAFAITALQAIPAVLMAGEDAVAFAEKAANAVNAMQSENRDPSDAEWQTLNDEIAALQKQIDGAA